jgi:O-antigen/teichoic acid export membrane protein
MLGIFRSEAEVGYYSIAVKLAMLTAFILKAVITVAAPKFSNLFYSDKIDELFYVAKKSAKLIFWTTVPILLSLIVLGKSIITLLYGSNFIVAYWAMIILIIGNFVTSISGPTAMFMNMTENHKIFRNIIFISALTNIGLSILLIPDFGICGAAVSSMASLVLWSIITLFYIKMKYGKTTGYFPFLA